MTTTKTRTGVEKPISTWVVEHLALRLLAPVPGGISGPITKREIGVGPR